MCKSATQQSVHLTLGILRQSQAVFYALAFFWLDGFAVPAPAQVTQTVGRRAITHNDLPYCNHHFAIGTEKGAIPIIETVYFYARGNPHACS